MAASSSPTTNSSNPRDGQTYIDQLSSFQEGIQKIQKTTAGYIDVAQNLQKMHPHLLHLIQRNTSSDVADLQQRVKDLTSILNKIGKTHNEGINLSAKQEKEAPEIFAKIADLIEKKDFVGARAKITEVRQLKLVKGILEQCDAFDKEIEDIEKIEKKCKGTSGRVDKLLDYDNFEEARAKVQEARRVGAPEEFCVQLEEKIQKAERTYLDDQQRFDAPPVESSVYKGQIPTSPSSSPEPAPVEAADEERALDMALFNQISDLIDAGQLQAAKDLIDGQDNPILFSGFLEDIDAKEAQGPSSSPTQSQSASSEEENLMLAAAEMIGEETGSREKVEAVLAQYGHVAEVADFCNSLLITIADDEARASASRTRSSSVATEPAPVDVAPVRERSATVAPTSAMPLKPTRPVPQPVQAVAAPVEQQANPAEEALNKAIASFNRGQHGIPAAQRMLGEISRANLSEASQAKFDKIQAQNPMVPYKKI